MRKILLLLLIAASCTKSDTCDFEDITPFNWIGDQSFSGYSHNMTFVDNTWTWETIELDQSEVLTKDYIGLELLEGKLFIFDRWGCYNIVGTDVNYNCNEVYLTDMKGNRHLLNVER